MKTIDIDNYQCRGCRQKGLVKDYGKTFRFSFSELTDVRTAFFLNILKLSFGDQLFLFSPAGVEFPEYRIALLLNELKSIVSDVRT